MAFLQIKKLLHHSIGLHTESIGESSIDRAINHRMTVTRSACADDYYKILKGNNEELTELIEEVVVPETWFFRNTTPFVVLRDNAHKIHASAIKKKTNGDNNALKVLSIPCSSGEEPYSISMALLESGLTSNDFKIDAVDVSRRVLKKAKRAIYGKHSFREQGVDIQNQYFEKIKTGYKLLPNIRECVSFQQGNILVDPISPSPRYYDIIFCRNLLIYFDRETQSKILDKLSMMLKDGGLLFVGHAEAGQIDKSSYTKIRVAKAFAFRKKRLNKPSTDLVINDDQPVNKLKEIYDQLVEVTKKDLEISNKINSPKYKSLKRQKKKESTQNIFKKIDSLVSAGHFSEASILCEQYLQEQPESSEAYYYLGLISSLQGSPGGAESLLRKAIYLSPNHYKALALSAVLAEKRGDDDSAKSLRRREEKARERNS